MYAIIKTGGKQHKVSVGDKLRVERLNVQPGEEVNFTPILVSADNKVDFNENGKWIVKATAVKELKARKVLVFHKKKRKQYKKLRGHRQIYTLIEVSALEK
ncbi:MAG TPA: 50S ribosomal protein L21 [Acidobacteriota bacterium]|jgi:large subunit ribosomal protein L21|nr:50S ribosomal protein L21 [Acidobacteriota bacterium]HNT18549.1 50S ribosomal protein L21 [Acidobacteriota bacterium]